MNVLRWALQVAGALLYGSSGVMKVFMFEMISYDVPGFGALPRNAWTTMGVLELVCAVGLVAPAERRAWPGDGVHRLRQDDPQAAHLGAGRIR